MFITFKIMKLEIFLANNILEKKGNLNANQLLKRTQHHYILNQGFSTNGLLLLKILLILFKNSNNEKKSKLLC